MGNQSWAERVAARVSSDDGMRKCIVRAIEMESGDPSLEVIASAEQLKCHIRQHSPGKCRMASLGEQCQCMLCAVDYLTRMTFLEDHNRQQLKEITAMAEELGWNGTDDSKILSKFLRSKLKPEPWWSGVSPTVNSSVPPDKCKNKNCNLPAIPDSPLPICEACDSMLRLIHAKMYGRPFEPKSTVDHLTLKLWEARAEKGGAPG